MDIGAGSIIDVSGGTDTKLAMESNVIEVQLLSELADNVVMRNSPLRGKKVRFDIRKGTRIADISKAIAKLEGGVGERTATGGTVTVQSEGEIIQRRNSRIDVSGGSIDYLPGYVNTTKLIANRALLRPRYGVAGHAVYRHRRPAQFPPQLRTRLHGRQGCRLGPAVRAGDRHAGRAPGLHHDRQVSARSRQRCRPLGGKLVIGSDNVAGLSAASSHDGRLSRQAGAGRQRDASMPSAPGVNESFDEQNPDHALLADRLDIDTAALSKAGFSRLIATTTGDIDIVAPLSLAAGGEVGLGAAGRIDFRAGASMPGGSLTARALGDLTVADGLSFDLAGTWTNDGLLARATRDSEGNATGDIILKGGKLDLSGGQVEIGNNVSMDVSGGAWQDRGRS